MLSDNGQVRPNVQYLVSCSSSFTQMILFWILTLPCVYFAGYTNLYILVENLVQSSVPFTSIYMGI